MFRFDWKWLLPFSWLLLLIAGFQLIAPGVADLWDSTASLLELADQIESAESLEADILRLRIESKQTGQQIATLVETMPNSGELSALYQALGDAGSLSGIRLQHIKPLRSHDGATHRQLDLEVQVSGQYWQLLRFLHDLEGSKKLFRIYRLDLTAGASQSRHLQAALGLRAFLRQE